MSKKRDTVKVISFLPIVIFTMFAASLAITELLLTAARACPLSKLTLVVFSSGIILINRPKDL